MSEQRAGVGQSLRSFWPLLRHDRLRFFLLTGTSLLGGLVEALTLVLITNLALSIGDPDRTVSFKVSGLQLAIAAGAAFALALAAVALRTALGVANGWLSADLSTRAAARLRTELNEAYLRADWAHQSAQQEGHLQDLLGTYVVQVSAGLLTATALTVATASLAMMVLSAILVSPIAAVTLGVGAAVLSLTLRPLRAATRRRARAFNAAGTELSLTVTESAQLMQEIRTFGVRESVVGRLDALVERTRLTGRGLYLLSGVTGYAFQGAALVLVVAALWVIYLASASNITALATVVLILVRSLSYAQQMQSALQTLQSYSPGADRVQEQLVALEANTTPDGTEPVERIGHLVLRDVTFAYTADRRALDSITATIERGSAIGLVGPSGAGKSTLVQILLRLREPTSGVFAVDETPASTLRSDDYYRRVAYVPQDNRLFDGTVRDNIAFFRDVTDDQIERAARRAHIHDEITSWPDGYETVVGVRGGSVSGGQRQRLCLARALLTEPDVLVLDEPTSALDLHSEALVQQTLEELHGRVTVIIVAHRLSTLKYCDRIMVLQDGRLEAFAPASELETTSAFFSKAMALTGQAAADADESRP